MASLHDQALELILRNYADVIEGGNAYRGSGTSWRGIPGSHSNDPELRQAVDTPLTAEPGGSTTTVIVAAARSWESSRWVKAETPGYFFIGATGTAANVGAARRVTGWNNTTKTFTTDAFPAAVAEDDTFTVRQGFKRVPNQEDPDRLGGIGFDRGFSLRAMPGDPVDYGGGGTATYRTKIEITLRMLKGGRMHDSAEAVLSNLALIREVITMAGQYGHPDHRDGTYTRALLPDVGSAQLVIDDKDKVVAADSYQLIYRINNAFL